MTLSLHTNKIYFISSSTNVAKLILFHFIGTTLFYACYKQSIKHILFYSILFYSVLFCSVLFYSILSLLHSYPVLRLIISLQVRIHIKTPYVSIDAVQIESEPHAQCEKCTPLSYQLTRQPSFPGRPSINVDTTEYIDSR